MRLFSLAICLVALLALVTAACAAPLYYEGFNYDAGTTIGPEGGWTTDSGGGFNVVDPGGTYSDVGGQLLQVSGNSTYSPIENKWQVVSTNLPQSVTDLFAQNGTFYATFLIREYASLSFVANPGLSSQILVSAGSSLRTNDIYNLTAEVQLNVWPNNVNHDATTGDQYSWNGLDWALWGMRIVMRDGVDEITLVRNPSLTGSIDWDTGFTTITRAVGNSYGRRADAIKINTIDITASGFTMLRVVSAGGVLAWTDGPLYKGGVDEIRVGTSWADVTESGIGSIRGGVNLQGYGGDVSDVGLRVELRRQGLPVITEKVFPDSLGNFTINNIAPDVYDIAIKAPSWLQEVLVGQLVSGETNIGNITLRNGDADGSSEVNTTDLSAVLKNIDVDGDL